MPPSFKGGLLCAMAALAAKTSTEARTPETIRFIKTSLRTSRISCGLDFSCDDHAGRRSQRQARCRAGNHAAVLADDAFSAERNGQKPAPIPESLPSAPKYAIVLTWRSRKNRPRRAP